MTPWIIIGIILLILYLLMQIRVGGAADYSADGLSAYAMVGCFKIVLFPRPKLTPAERDKKAAAKQKKEEKKKRKKEKSNQKKSSDKAKKKKKQPAKPEKPEDKRTKIGGTVDLIFELLPILGKALSRLKRKIRINQLNIELSIGGDDAAAVAIAYGRVSSVGPYLVSWAEENLDLREHQIQVVPDFLGGSTSIAIQAKLTFTIGQLLRIVLNAAFSALAVFIRHKQKRKNNK